MPVAVADTAGLDFAVVADTAALVVFDTAVADTAVADTAVAAVVAVDFFRITYLSP